MPTIKLSGPGLNSWFAEMMVKDQGPERALENTSGPMRKAVEEVIAAQQAQSSTKGGDAVGADQKGGA